MNKVTENDGKSSGGMKPPVIARILDEPTKAERDEELANFIASQARIREERRAAADVACPALERLGDAMAHKTGQSYHLRALLYSLWNGKPVSLIEILNLDWSLRKDLCAVLLAFGYESIDAMQCFMYRTIEDAMKKRGLLAWFLEQGDKEVAA